MPKINRDPLEEQLQNLKEKIEGENKTLKKILMNLNQPTDQSQTQSSKLEKDSIIQKPKKAKKK